MMPRRARRPPPAPPPPPPNRRARLAAWLRAATPAWLAPRVLLICAGLLLGKLYVTNTDMGGDPVSKRGDGVYRPVLARGDGHMLYLMARSTALDLDWNFDNDLARFGDPWREPRTVTGRKAIVHPIGPALVWTPLIWLAELGAWLADGLGGDVELHGYTLWHQRFVFCSSVLFACGVAWLGWRLLRRHGVGAWAAAYGGIAVLLGTSLTYYATHMPSYAHAMDAFACAAFLAYWAGTRARVDRRRFVVLGLLLGLAALIRIQELAMGAVLVVELLAPVPDGGDAPRRHRPREVILGAAIMAAFAAVVLVPQLYEWHVVFGKTLALPQGPRFTRPGSPMILEVLFSSRNGWLSTTPVAYAGVLGLVVGLFIRPVRALAAGLLLVTCVQVYLNSTVEDWWSSASFGQRRLCSLSLPILVGNALLLGGLGAWLRSWWARLLGHVAVVVVFGTLVRWNLGRVHELRAGKAAPQGLSRACCDHFPEELRGLKGYGKQIYDAIGDPFQLPASLWFAWRHDVPIQRFDLAVGEYPIEPGLGAFMRDELEAEHGVWGLGGPGGDPYVVRGLSGSQPSPPPGEPRWRRLTAEAATALVPNLLPYPQWFRLAIKAERAGAITALWNGAEVATWDVRPGWGGYEFAVPTMAVGTNELTLRAAGPVGWAGIGSLTVQLQPFMSRP